MATRRPTGAVTKQSAVVDIANVKPGCGRRSLRLRVALEAQVGIALDEHFGINRTVRVVANGATFAERGVFKNEGAGLFAMTLSAGFVLTRHGEPARGLHDVHAVRIVALDAIHFTLNDGMMLWQMKFSLSLLMALKTRFGVLAGIDDEFFEAAASGHGDMLAAWSMAGFTAARAGHFGVGQPQSRMRAAGEHPRNVRVTIKTSLVADVSRAFDLQRRDDRPVGGTGVQQ